MMPFLGIFLAWSALGFGNMASAEDHTISSRGWAGFYYSCAFKREIHLPWGAPPIEQTWHLYISHGMIIRFWPALKDAVPGVAEKGAGSIDVYNQLRTRWEDHGLLEFSSPGYDAGVKYFLLGFPDFGQKKMEIGVGLEMTGTEESMICEQIPSPF